MNKFIDRISVGSAIVCVFVVFAGMVFGILYTLISAGSKTLIMIAVMLLILYCVGWIAEKVLFKK